MTIWDELDLDPTGDTREVRRAYARRLRQVHPEDDPEGFQRLRAAYEQALAICEAPGDGIAFEAPGDGIAPARFRPTDQTWQDFREPEPGTDVEAETHFVAAVEQMIDTIFDALADGDEIAAVEALNEALRNPLLINFELRRHLERRLIEELSDLPQVPDDLVLAACAPFGWDEDLRHLPPGHADFVVQLRAAPEGRLRISELRRAGEAWPAAFLFDRGPFAAALLTGGFRPRLFRLAALDHLTVPAVASLLNELRVLYPAVTAQTLDANTLDWWQREADGPPTAPRARLRRALGQAMPVAALLLLGYLVLAGPEVAKWVKQVLIPVTMLYLALRYLPPALRMALGLLHAPRRLYEALAAGATAVGALAALTLGQPWPQVGTGVCFFGLLVLAGDRDLPAFIPGAVVLWLAWGISLRLAGFEFEIELLFLASQLMVLGLIKLWRLVRPAAGPDAEHEYMG